MPSLGDAITRFHRLVEQNGFGHPAWCEDLQNRMRQLNLVESGRLLSPVLRPCFITQKQADTLAKTAEHFSAILDTAKTMVLAAPAYMSRIQMLPVEKMLAAVPVASPRLSMSCRLDALPQKSGFLLEGMDASQPSGLAYANVLADLFLELPILKEFKRNGYKLSKLGSSRQLYTSILAEWRSFGGKSKRPHIAVVEMALPAGSGASEGQLLADALTAQGADAELVSPDHLEYTEGELRSGGVRIDVVFRRVLTREILTKFDLSHPLLQAYREGAICMVNSFQSEIGRRRAFLELLSDQAFVAHFPAADRKLISGLIPWTRVVSQRRTKYKENVVDLIDFIQKQREDLVLLPNEDTPQERIYVGAGLSQSSWERAIRSALRTPYVVQERGASQSESFPFFLYGEFKVDETEVVLQPQVLNGQLAAISASLRKSSGGSLNPVGIAPVLVIEL